MRGIYPVVASTRLGGGGTASNQPHLQHVQFRVPMSLEIIGGYMADESPINRARLPLFSIESKSWTTIVRNPGPLTVLVDASKQRHDYIVRPSAPPYLQSALYQIVLNNLQKKAVRNELDRFEEGLGEQLRDPRIGYLVRVNFATDSQGTNFPSVNLLTGVGFGTEPLDALAEVYRSDTISSRIFGKNASHYLWYTRVGGKLEATTYAPDLSRLLEGRASAEAARRNILGQVFRPLGPKGPEQSKVADYWFDFAQRHTWLTDSRERLKTIVELNARAQAAQADFNAALTNYHAAQRELRNNAAEMQTLSAISNVLGLLKSVSAAVDEAQTWRQQREQELSTRQTSLRSEAVGVRQRLNGAHSDIQTEWHNRGMPVGTPPQVPPVPPLYVPPSPPNPNAPASDRLPDPPIIPDLA